MNWISFGVGLLLRQRRHLMILPSWGLIRSGAVENLPKLDSEDNWTQYKMQAQGEHQHWQQHDVPPINKQIRSKIVATQVIIRCTISVLEFFFLNTFFFPVMIMRLHTIRTVVSSLWSTKVLLTHKRKTLGNRAAPCPTRLGWI